MYPGAEILIECDPSERSFTSVGLIPFGLSSTIITALSGEVTIESSVFEESESFSISYSVPLEASAVSPEFHFSSVFNEGSTFIFVSYGTFVVSSGTIRTVYVLASTVFSATGVLPIDSPFKNISEDGEASIEIAPVFLDNDNEHPERKTAELNKTKNDNRNLDFIRSSYLFTYNLTTQKRGSTLLAVNIIEC